MSARAPLSEIRVLDFGWVWSGPMVSGILADLGAEVIKIEHRDRLDNARLRGAPTVGPALDGPPEEVTPYFHQNNSGKASVTVDMKHPDGNRLLRSLIDASDVLIENLSPGVLARNGLGWEELSTTNPRLIYLAMSTIGQDGPLAGIRAYAPVMTSFAGAESLVGYEDDPVLGMITFGVADPNAASHALVALMAALVNREQSGRGQFIDFSQIDAMVATLSEAIAEVQLADADPTRRGMRHPSYAPHNHYPCSGDDRWIALAAGSDAEWRRMCTALGAPELSRDERFATAQARHRNAAELDREIAAVTSSHDRDALFGRMRVAKVPAAPVYEIEEAQSNPHIRARGLYESVEHPVSGPEELTRVPWRLRRTPASIGSAAPLVGEHTHEVLTRVLGLSPEEIGRLEVDGVLR